MPLGTSKVNFIRVDKDFVVKTATDVFLKYRAELIAELRQSLISVNRDQPGDLLQSIDAKVLVTHNDVTFEILMNDYWKFVDEGVDGTERSVGSQYKFKKAGKRIPLDSMKKFISAHGYAPKTLQKQSKKVKKKVKRVDRMKEFEKFAFAIGYNLKKKGVKPTHFFTNVINDELKLRMTADITAALKRDIELDFEF